MSVGKLEGAGSKVEQLCVTVLKDDKGYGMTVSGNDPVIVQSVVKNGAAWRAGVRYGDRLLQVNNVPVEKSMHHDVVGMIKSSATATLVLQRTVSLSKVTAPLPVDRERQRQVENTKIQTFKMMLEDEIRYKEKLQSMLAHSPTEKIIKDLEAAETRISQLKEKIANSGQPSFIVKQPQTFIQDPPATPPRQPLMSNIPRSLTSLTGQSLRSNRHSQGAPSPVTCLDGTPPPLPPRTPNIQSPGGIPPKTHPLGAYPQPPQALSPRHLEPNSIGVQMNYPLAVSHPPIQILPQTNLIGHQRSRSSPEQLGHLNNTNDSKDWEVVVTPPGTPPPPYPVSPHSHLPIDPQKDIMSMEEDESSTPIIQSQYSFGGFDRVANLSTGRIAVFLNWIAGERRPPQAALLYLLSTAYSTGPFSSLPRWAYELHSIFLVPGAPLALSNVDENMAREIDDVLINESEKEDVLRKIFTKAREKAEEELNQQLQEFQVKRQSGLGSFYGPADSVLEACMFNRTQETHVIISWLMPRLNTWIEESMGEPWGATYGSPLSAVLAAAILPLLHHTFGFKTQHSINILGTPPAGTPPRPSFLQRDKHYKQRIKFLNKTNANSLSIRGHHLTAIAVTSVCHCNHCHMLIYGIAPQAYHCSDCRLLVHRSCVKRIEEPCCGPPVAATRISRIMEKLAPSPGIMPTSNCHQHIDSNQHVYHHHDKKQRKSLGTAGFLNMERSFRKTEEEIHANLEHNLSQSFSADIELEITPPEGNLTEDEKKELEEKRDEFTQLEPEASSPVVLTDSECESDKKKKNKPKHRKTMSMSNTIELVKSVGDEWLEAAKREIGEHSKKRENAKKKKESPVAEVNHFTPEKNDVVLLLSDATIGESDDFEIVPYGKSYKKKDCKSKELTPKVASSHVMSAQKMGVKMIAKASTVGALNFIRKKRPAPIIDSDNTSDYILLSTELFLESERNHSDLVRVEKKTEIPKEILIDNKSASEEEGEVYYDAKEESETAEEDHTLTQEIKPKIVKSDSRVVIGSRSRKSFGGSLKRTGGGRRRGRRKSAVDDVAPPLPPKSTHPGNHELFVVPKHSHWLFGSSFKGDGKIGTDDGADGAQHIPEVWDKNFDHSADRAEGSHGGVRQRPVTRAESYRDKATKVHRTKRKTSDPNQLTSGNAYNDAEATGNIGAPSGGSSSSSLSSRSNESAAGQPDNQDSHSEWSDEEDSAEPWSTKASPEILANMSMKARKRQDLIHELITTEISHVRWLRILRRVFLSPFQRTNLLPPGELKALFPNLPDVLQRHRKLSADLKTLAASASVVKTKPLAEALINTLGEPKYPVALAKFCGGQRLALDVLRDRKKRNKELYNFILRREQEPLCARKRLQDFLACVWQRLTKYQLLLEGISKTITDEDDSEPDKEEAVTKLAHALELAKDILHTVDTAIKTTENEHRLKTIQSKLEVRGVGTESEPGELRRLDLVRHSLVIEGSLLIRQDSTKRLTVHALMLSECLVLLQKESDKYILRPIPQAAHQPLSPVVNWNTVFFRTNAAVKNGFFLVNINGVQMYDMSVTNSTEYNTWIRHISEAAKALGPRSNTIEEGPPPPLPSNPPPVTATNTEEPPESSEPNVSVDEEKDEPPAVNDDDGIIVSGATRLIEGETEDSHRPNKFVEEELTNLSSVDIVAPPPTLTAHRQLTAEERLRQAEEKVKLALQEAAEAAKEVAESTPSIYTSAMESLLGKTPIEKQWRTSIGNGLNTTAESDRKSSKDLLLAAQSHVNTLTDVLFKALRVTPVGSDCAMTKCSVSSNHGFCDSCASKHAKFIKTAKHDSFGKGDGSSQPENDVNEKTNNSNQKSDEQNNGKFDSFVTLDEPGESSTDPNEETDLNSVTTSSLGLREILSMLLQRLPAEERERELLRSRLQQADSRLHYLHHMHRDCVHTDGEMEKDSLQEVPDFISNDKSSEG